MGCYVNPPKESKESWLEREGERVQMPVMWQEVPKGKLPVILMNNGAFTAAGVGFSDRELNAFQEPTDPRPKLAYLVAIEKLEPVAAMLKDYLATATADHRR